MTTLRQFLLIALIVILNFSLWAAISYFTYKYWVHNADHRDFYPRWAGVRYLFSGNRNVYSEGATHAIQETLYGTTLSADQDQQGFAYPIQLAILLFSFAFISNVEIATAIWQGLSFIILFSSLLLLTRHVNDSTNWLPIIFLLWQYPLLMIYQGQMTIIPLVSLIISIILYSRGRDFLSGIILSLCIVKPQISLIPMIIFGFCAIKEKRFNLIKGFALANIILLTLSFYIADWWIPDWINALSSYASYAKVVWPIYDIYRFNPLLSFIVIIGLIFSVIKFRNQSQPMIALSVAIGMLLIPQTLNWDLTMLIIPLFYSWRAKTKPGVIIIWVLGWSVLLLSGIQDWWKIQSIFMPLLVIILLILAYKETS